MRELFIGGEITDELCNQRQIVGIGWADGEGHGTPLGILHLTVKAQARWIACDE
jgi:hypothetical protein